MTSVAASPAPRRRGNALLRTLAPLVRRQAPLLAGGLVLMLLASAAQLAQPLLVREAVDGSIAAGDLQGFTAMLAVFAAVVLGETLCRRGQVLAVERAGQNALFDLRDRLFGHLQRLPTTTYDRTPTGRLVGRVTTDVDALQELFSSGVVTVLGDLVFLAGALGVLFFLSAELTLRTLVVVPVLVAVTVFVRRRVRATYGVLRSRLSEMNAFLHEHVGGMPTVQAFNLEDRSRGRFDGINDGVRGSQLHTVRWESVLSAATELLGSVTTALILWSGGMLAGAGGDGPTLGTLIAFVDTMARFFAPLNDLSQKYTVLQNALVAGERIDDLLRLPTEPPDADPPATVEGRGAVAFEDVTFGYDPDHPVVHDLSFAVRPGESVALVGATGAGKSTVLSLLTRLHEVQHGRITLDGVDIRRLRRRDLRRIVGIVPQDTFLFGGTVLDNIRIGHPEITEEAARAAADGLHLDEVVARFPRGYDEPLAERGGNLSMGERQLIAFARMMVVAPRVLVLDEATANVDSHTEELLQEAVGRLMRGRTSIVVAHRLATVRGADRILVLDRGRVVEEGGHEELLERGGVYARLHEVQFRDGGDGR